MGEGGMKTLIRILGEGNQAAEAPAVTALKLLAQDSQSQDIIREEGGIQILINVLHEGDNEAEVQAAGALWILAGKGRNREVIRQEGGIEPLIEAIRKQSWFRALLLQAAFKLHGCVSCQGAIQMLAIWFSPSIYIMFVAVLSGVLSGSVIT